MIDAGRTICESEYGDGPNNLHVRQCGGTVSVVMTYPNVTGNGVKYVEVNQESVRASDGVRLSYDYARDGWVIEQPTRTCWAGADRGGDGKYDGGWREVAFVESWHFRAEQEENERLVMGDGPGEVDG